MHIFYLINCAPFPGQPFRDPQSDKGFKAGQRATHCDLPARGLVGILGAVHIGGFRGHLVVL